MKRRDILSDGIVIPLQVKAILNVIGNLRLHRKFQTEYAFS